MKKIVWAIAAVFSIQVAFQLAMTAQRSDAEYAAMQMPLRQPVGVSATPKASDDDLYIPATLEDVLPISRPETNVGEPRSYGKTRPGIAGDHSSVHVETASTFQ